MNTDKASREYWDHNWSDRPTPRLINEMDISLDNYVNRHLHLLFQKIFAGKKSFRILEIGCANSVWPIYFHKQYNADAHGIDYSETGCKISKALHGYYGIDLPVHFGDIFFPPENLEGTFDYVVSFGVVEHFENTALTLEACSKFLKPEGELITLIPNLTSILGQMQKIIGPGIYSVHKPLSSYDFISAHNDAKLCVMDCNYFLPINLSVLNTDELNKPNLVRFLRKAFSGISKIVWSLENKGFIIPATKFFSPYIICRAKKSVDDSK